MSGNNERLRKIFCDCSPKAYWVVNFTYDNDDNDFKAYFWVSSDEGMRLWNNERHSFNLFKIQLPEQRIRNVTFEDIKNDMRIRCGHCGNKKDVPKDKILRYIEEHWNKRHLGLGDISDEW